MLSAKLYLHKEDRMSLRMSLAPDEELYVIRDLHDERCLLRHIGYKVVQLLKKKYIPLPQIKR